MGIREYPKAGFIDPQGKFIPHPIPPAPAHQNGPLPSWNIPVNPGHEYSPNTPLDPAEGWNEAFAQLRKIDVDMQTEFKEGIDTLLVFAGLFSAVLTAFVIQANASLQEDSAQTAVDALYHISLQLHDPSVAPLPARSPFQPASYDVRVNAIWLCSLILSLVAALLAILVKQWLREYMTWTSMISGKESVALRQYRAQGWDNWYVSQWRYAIPGLLQAALVLFFWGLVDLFWNVQATIAIIVTSLVGVSLGVLLMISFIPVINAQCPYRSTLSRLLRNTYNGLYQTGRFGIQLLSTILPTRMRVHQPHQSSVRECTNDFLARISGVSWDFHDLQQTHQPSLAHDYAIQAAAKIVAKFPSSEILGRLAAGIHSDDNDAVWIPVQNLWCLLEGLFGEDSASREHVFSRLRSAQSAGLCAAIGLPEDFCRKVVHLLRQAVCHQRACSNDQLRVVERAIDLSSIVANAEASLFPYHATTLVLLLHERAPPQLHQIAGDRLESLACELMSLNPAATRWTRWCLVDITAFFRVTSRLLQQARATSKPAVMNATIIALHVAKLHFVVTADSAEACPWLADLFNAFSTCLRSVSLLPWDTFQRLLRPELLHLLVDVIRTAPHDPLLIPFDLIGLLCRCLGHSPEESERVRGLLDKSQLARVLHAAISRAYDPVTT